MIDVKQLEKSLKIVVALYKKVSRLKIITKIATTTTLRNTLRKSDDIEISLIFDLDTYSNVGL